MRSPSLKARSKSIPLYKINAPDRRNVPQQALSAAPRLLHLCQTSSICLPTSRGVEKLCDDPCAARSTGLGCEHAASRIGIHAAIALPLLLQHPRPSYSKELDRTCAYTAKQELSPPLPRMRIEVLPGHRIGSVGSPPGNTGTQRLSSAPSATGNSLRRLQS